MLQLAHLARPLLVQAAPVAAAPFEHVHVLAEQVLAVESNVYPASQLAQIFAEFVVQLAPVAAVPPEQVQVFARHDPELNRYPALQLAQIAVLLVQADPVAALPLLQVQVFAAQDLSEL